jgi:hypothetical protein
VHQGTPSWTHHLRKFSEALRYNSPDCPVHHRTVSGAPRKSGSELASFGNPLRYNSPDMSGEPAEQRLLRAQRSTATHWMRACARRGQSTRGWHTGQSTGLVRCTTGQPGGPTRQSSNGRNPTARWRGWRTGLSDAPCDNNLHQTASLVVGVINTVVGVINTPNHPTFKSSKFSTFQPLKRALAFNSRHTKVIKFSPNSTQSFSD